MSGHSKWSTIKRKKGKTDAQRAKVYTKIGRELAIAVREGGGNPESNNKLRDVIAKAKASNMPGENIQRAIKKAAGEDSSIIYEEITYEGYAPGGVAVIVEALTDNRNRAAADIRHIFDKNGGSMGATGCVGWMFDRKGVLTIEFSDGMDEEQVMMDALEAGAADVDVQDDVIVVYTDPIEFSAVREALESTYSFLSAEVQMMPQNTVEVADEDAIAKINKMLDMFDDNDDVQDVWHNANLPEEEEDDA